MKFINLLLAFFARLFPQRVDFIGGGGNLPAPLSREEENAAVSELKVGSESARRKLIEHNLRLVVFVAKRFENTGVPLDDLISIGTVGLIKAVESFDLEKNIKLATYASRCIENEILMFLRKTSARAREVSISEPLSTDSDGNELSLSDVLSSDGEELGAAMESEEDGKILREALSRLSDREQQLITLRFGLRGGDEKTQKEVADLLGISQSYISRLEKRILLRLRREILKLTSH